MLHTDCVPVAVLNVLERLRDHPALGGFYLAGGTSLALRFGHRVSVDLDFFTDQEFDPENLAEELAVFGGRIMNRAPSSLTLETERFVVLKSLAWFDDADQEPGVESRDGRSWEVVKRDVAGALAKLAPTDCARGRA